MPVILRDIQGLSTEEASAVLRVKPQTLKSRLHRGRLILREALSQFAGRRSRCTARDQAVKADPAERVVEPCLLLTRVARDAITRTTPPARAPRAWRYPRQ